MRRAERYPTRGFPKWLQKSPKKAYHPDRGPARPCDIVILSPTPPDHQMPGLGCFRQKNMLSGLKCPRIPCCCASHRKGNKNSGSEICWDIRHTQGMFSTSRQGCMMEDVIIVSLQTCHQKNSRFCMVLWSEVSFFVK